MSDLWLPNAIRKPIPQTATDPNIITVGDIFHVAVSEAESLFTLFENDGGIESTGYIRRDGTVEQYRPVNVECDAQFDGNSWVGSDGRRYGFNSWETQGMGTGEWTPQQINTIKFIMQWKHANFGTPWRVCPDWNQGGFGYHSMFERWNKTNHSCPGPDRIKQFETVLVPWIHQQAAPPAPVGPVSRGPKIDHAIADLTGSPRWRAQAARKLLLSIPPIKK